MCLLCTFLSYYICVCVFVGCVVLVINWSARKQYNVRHNTLLSPIYVVYGIHLQLYTGNIVNWVSLINVLCLTLFALLSILIYIYIFTLLVSL